MQVGVRLQICRIQSQERDVITTAPSSESKGDAIVRLFSAKGFNAFRELCVTLELESPHLGPIWCMKFSLCGRLLATAGQDCILRIWVLR